MKSCLETAAIRVQLFKTDILKILGTLLGGGFVELQEVRMEKMRFLTAITFELL